MAALAVLRVAMLVVWRVMFEISYGEAFMVICKNCERPILLDHAYRVGPGMAAQHIRCDEPDLHAPRAERRPELVASRA